MPHVRHRAQSTKQGRPPISELSILSSTTRFQPPPSLLSTPLPPSFSFPFPFIATAQTFRYIPVYRRENRSANFADFCKRSSSSFLLIPLDLFFQFTRVCVRVQSSTPVQARSPQPRFHPKSSSNMGFILDFWLRFNQNRHARKITGSKITACVSLLVPLRFRNRLLLVPDIQSMPPSPWAIVPSRSSFLPHLGKQTMVSAVG